MRYIITDMHTNTKLLIQLYCSLHQTKYPKLYEYYEKNKNIITTKDQLKLNGNDIMKLFGLKNKKIGNLKNHLFKSVIEKKVLNERQTLIKFSEKYLNK